VEFRVIGNDGSELLGKCVTVTVKSLGEASTACSRHNYSSGNAPTVPALVWTCAPAQA